MRISIPDFIFIFSGFIYGIYEIVIDDTHVYITKIVGMLSFILSLWVLVSCIESRKDKTEH
jgi:hypothetical protein